jgi:hypothetical protein
VNKISNFNNLYFISHQPGTVGDSLTAFLSMHEKSASFEIVGNRMRTATPGILLNWAHYYKNWTAQQSDPNLYKAIDIKPDISNFAQAHFFLEEKQILDKFPKSKAIRILVANETNMETYFKWLYHKLMNKRMHRAWHDRYLKFAPLRDKHTQATLLNMCANGQLRIKHYWSCWYIDNLGLDLNLVSNPFEYWLTRKYVKNFHPNLATMLVDNRTAIQRADDPDVISVYIDRLFPLSGTGIDISEYTSLCHQVELTPNLELAQNFWQWWRPGQPNADDIVIDTDWP